MKKKTYKIFGVSLVVMLIASLLVFAIPTSAQPYGTKDNAWEYHDFVAGAAGGWVYDSDIYKIGPIAKDKDGATIYAYVEGASPPARAAGDFFVSKDGYSWATSSDPNAWSYGRVVDMVCSGRDAETIYATDGNYVYKSLDGAMNWSIVAQENLELFLMGDCGIPITCEPITCIDVGYNGSDESILFIGTRNVGHHYPAGHAEEYQAIVGTVLWINEETYPAEWYDLGLPCYGCCTPEGMTDVAAEWLGYGDGTTTAFAGNLVNTPIEADTVVFTDNDTAPQVVEDDSAGVLTGDGSGTVNYETGAYSVTFNTAPAGNQYTNDDTNQDTADDVYSYSGNLTAAVTPFSGAPFEIVPGSVTISDSGTIQTFSDNGDGTLTGDVDGTGTINYTTGAWTLDYGTADPGAVYNILADFDEGVPVTAAYTYYSGGMGCFDVFSVAAAPNFADTGKAYVLVSRPTTMTFDLTENTGFVEVNATSAGATLDYSTLPDEISITLGGGSDTDDGSVVTLAAGSYCTFDCDGSGTGTADVQFSVTAGQIENIVCPGADCAYATVCEAATEVISTVGTTCSWNKVSELFWDCDSDNNFEIRHGSRFAFGDDFADANELFIGVTGTYPYGYGGDVYSTTDTPGPDAALDRNVQGFSTGCLGFYHANICSLDMKGSTADGSLIAGAYDAFEHQLGTTVHASSDGGWTWAPSKKNPTGVFLTYVLWFGNTAVAGTTGCDCGFSMSCGDVPGEYWNQTSLIAIEPDDREDMDQSPEYVDGSSTVYMLFSGGSYEKVLLVEDESCVWDWEGRVQCPANTSLFRYDGAHWERVFSSSTYATPGGDAQMDWVETSPDFNTTGCLYLASEDFQMYRSMDRGCSWAPLSYPCEPRPDISAWIVVDEETVLAAGCGMVYKTTRHGTRPWDTFPIQYPVECCWAVDFDLSPNIGSDGQVLLGDECGNVFISENVGSTWDKVWTAPGGPPCNVLPSANTYVQFDPSYGTGSPDAAGMNMIYAAAGNVIARCNINADAPWVAQCWETLKSDVCYASGIDAQGDTALYVSDAGGMEGPTGDLTVTGSLAVNRPCDIDFYPWTVDYCYCDYWLWGAIEGIDLEVLDGAFIYGELLTVLEYDLTCFGDIIVGAIGVQGYESGAMAEILINPYGIPPYNTTSFLGPCPECPTGAACELLSSYLRVVDGGVGSSAACLPGVWRSLNPLDPIPAGVPFSAIIEFELLTDATIQGAGAYLIHGDNTPQTDNLWLTTNGSSNVLWCLDENNETFVWNWSDPLANPVILSAPACGGAQLVSPSSVTLSWDALDAATEYEIELYQYCPQCPDERLEIDVPNSTDTCVIVEGLAPGTEHFWRVRVAYDSPKWSKWSELCSFTTALGAIPSLCSPPCGAEDVILNTNFSWDEVPGAASYELQIVAAGEDGTADFTGAETKTTDVNALASIPGLEYSTTYYWRVRAITGSVPGAWSVCLFTTMDEPEEPVPPADLVVNIPEDEVITPTWMWVLIGIGAALTIAVIILIVTTRRVP